jgi:ArsR family transcriptional regulator, arsenate/arsenite/antimonite-responsive transcriptional repressor
MLNIDINQYLWRSILHTALESVNILPKQPASGCCPPLLTAHLTSEELTRIASIFRVLGEPARLQLLNLIAAQPSQEVRACELVETLGLSQPTVSHHLKVMYEAGLLTKERRGTWIYYRVVTDRLSELRSVLA